jgi:sensor c-di-GMP phosphodiesterase-like protein
LINIREKRETEKTKRESELPVFMIRYTERLQRQKQEANDKTERVSRARCSPENMHRMHSSILPPSKLFTGRRLRIPNAADAVAKKLIYS